MIDPLLVGLDVSVQHRARAAPTHLVPGPMDLEPFRGALFSAAEFIAHGRDRKFPPRRR